MLSVGLTGGIASGKSRVRRRFEAGGCATLDLDAVTHELLRAGQPGQRAVKDAFGPAVVAANGSIDRRALGALVFGDEGARRRLNALLHPLIRSEANHRAEILRTGGARLVVTEATLLVESGGHLRFDRLVVVVCPEEEQVRRLARRDGLSDAAARSRVRVQMSNADKRHFGHFVIDSSGSPDDTDRRADEALAHLHASAATLPAPWPVRAAPALGCLLHGPAEGPAGLTPRLLLRSIAESGGVELQALAGLLDPPRLDGQPWYAPQAAAAPDAAGPEALAGPLALWALARHGPDEAFVAGAAASLCRLTHASPAWITRAVVAAGVVFDTALAGRLPPAGAGRIAHWAAFARQFGGGPSQPGWRMAETLAAAREAEAAGPGEVARRAHADGADPALAGALAGLVAGARSVDEDLTRDLAHALGW